MRVCRCFNSCYVGINGDS